MKVRFLKSFGEYESGQICPEMPNGMAEELTRYGTVEPVEPVKDIKDEKKKSGGAKQRSAA